MLKVVQMYHGDQYRDATEKIPYWHHCYGVATLLLEYINQAGEVPADICETMILAALGHDLYEDTDIPRAEILNKFGPVVDEYIFALTNEQSDADRAQYIEKLANDCDEVILIKMADMLDNLTSVYGSIVTLGKPWLKDYFLPIMEDTIVVVNNHQFDKYHQTSVTLKTAVNTSLSLLRKAQDDLLER